MVATPAGFVLTPSDVIKDIRVGAEEREEIFPVRKETNPVKDYFSIFAKTFLSHQEDESKTYC